MPHSVDQFTCQWTFGLLLPLGYCKCCYEHGCVDNSLRLLSILLDIYPEVELLDYMVVLFLIFQGTTMLFSIVILSFYNLTSNAQGIQLFHIPANTCYFLGFLNSSYPNGCKMISHGFDLHLSDG